MNPNQAEERHEREHGLFFSFFFFLGGGRVCVPLGALEHWMGYSLLRESGFLGKSLSFDLMGSQVGRFV